MVIFFYVIGWAWKREGWKKLKDVDVDSGRREIDWEAFEKIRAKKAGWSKWRRALDKIV